MINENLWNELSEGWRNLRDTSIEILDFLKKGYPNTFKQKEIIEGIKYEGKSKNLSGILVRLKEKGLIKSKKPYWRFVDCMEKKDEQ